MHSARNQPPEGNSDKDDAASENLTDKPLLAYFSKFGGFCEAELEAPDPAYMQLLNLPCQHKGETLPPGAERALMANMSKALYDVMTYGFTVPEAAVEKTESPKTTAQTAPPDDGEDWAGKP